MDETIDKKIVSFFYIIIYTLKEHMIVKLKDKEVELKASFRAYMLYENITQKSFAPTTMTDVITFFYCILITSAKDYDFKYNEFLDMLDERPEYLTEFSEWLVDEFNKNTRLSPNESEDKKKVQKTQKVTK